MESKVWIIIFGIINIFLFSGVASAVYVVRDDGSWGISLNVEEPPAVVTYNASHSGSWGILLVVSSAGEPSGILSLIKKLIAMDEI